MIARMGSGWQTVLADLSLILFMITAAAVSQVKPAAPTASPFVQPALPAMGEPMAVWRPGPGMPSLADWLKRSAGDPRLRLTILASPAAAQAALDLAQGSGRPARVVIEPGMQGAPLATLTYDQGGLAQPVPDPLAKEMKP